MKKTIQHIIATGALLIITILVTAQTENTAIRAGNKLYRKGQFEKAVPEYQKALQVNPNNPVARYNMGNVQFRNKQL